ncbi:hypothetical protein [Amycolatopsis sp. NPDC004079]|uniref:hypothetical protein n=1 Tax=Amycolatopsis sp. NPDC004079 TaxID=3154549 RepID=UPI0033B08B3C
MNRSLETLDHPLTADVPTAVRECIADDLLIVAIARREMANQWQAARKASHESSIAALAETADPDRASC